MLHLVWGAVSDVGRVRKDNQDSGYAGPHLLTVCDGVGGAARGDIASGTAVTELRRLDATPAGTGSEDDLLSQVSHALHRAHDRIGDLVDEDPELNGTSTTATVMLFDGLRVGVAHVGDSRGYLLRAGQLSQLTKDHTFVQSLIDEGRITEDEAKVHPHRNLILKALDGVHEADPDLFTVELADGDRLLLCSDGACGVLDADEITAQLSTGTPEHAAAELVRLALEAGSTDNVTCVVADVVADEVPAPAGLRPLVVGAASDLPRRLAGRSTGPVTGAASAAAGFFRGRGSSDTSEIPAVPGTPPPDLPQDIGFAIPSDPLDPEQARYAPGPPQRYGWLRWLLGGLALVGLLWAVGGGLWAWSQGQYWVGSRDGAVTIYRGVDGEVLGLSLSRPYEAYPEIPLDQLSCFDADKVRSGLPSGSLAQARESVAGLQVVDDATAQDCDEADSGTGGNGGTDDTDPGDTTAPTAPTSSTSAGTR